MKLKYFLLLTFLAPSFSWAKYYIDFTKDGIIVEKNGVVIKVPIDKKDWDKGPDYMVEKALIYVEANKEKFTKE